MIANTKGFPRAGIIAAALAFSGGSMVAQTVLRGVEFSQPPGSIPVLRADFLLPEPEAVSSVEASAGWKSVGADKVKFTAAAKLPDLRCAILFLVDNTPDVAEYFPHIKQVLGKFADYAETTPYQMGLANFSDEVQFLVPMGGKTADLKSPQTLDKIDGSGPSTEIYLCAQHAITLLSQTKAARKFLVIISNGRGEDKKYTHEETVRAAQAAGVRICTIGYALPKGDNPSYLQTLTKLSEETGGYKGRANVLTRELPDDFEPGLLKYAVSGGQADADMSALKAPVTLDFKVTTESKKEYTFSRQLDVFAVQMPPEKKPDKPEKPVDPVKPDKPDEPGKGPKPPDKGGTKAEKPPDKPGKVPSIAASSKPAVPKTWFEKIKQQVKEHQNIAAIGGGALLMVLVLLVAGLRRWAKGPGPDTSGMPPVAPQFVTTEPETPAAAPVELPALAWLESLDAEQTRHAIRKPAVRVGRRDDNDIVLRNDSVSSYHAELLKRDGQFFITDLGGANGIYINHKRVEKSPLAHDDLIELGEVRFRFLLPAEDPMPDETPIT